MCTGRQPQTEAVDGSDLLKSQTLLIQNHYHERESASQHLGKYLQNMHLTKNLFNIQIYPGNHKKEYPTNKGAKTNKQTDKHKLQQTLH